MPIKGKQPVTGCSSFSAHEFNQNPTMLRPGSEEYNDRAFSDDVVGYVDENREAREW
jgi:hypothetical protein